MSRPVQQPPRMMQNVFVILLLAIFALLSTLLVTMGAQLYRSTVARADNNNNARIMSAVVRSAVWAEDGGEVLIEDLDTEEGQIRVLSIVERYDDEAYYKRLFCYDGYLRESYSSEEREFEADDGETLCELASFEPSIEGSMLTIVLKAADGTESTIKVCLRAGGNAQ